MAEEETKKAELCAEAPATESLKEVASEEKALVVVATATVVEEVKVIESKTLDSDSKTDVCKQDTKSPEQEKEEGNKVELESCMNRDAVLARVATEKRLCFIRAWEESQKSKAENRAEKKLSEIGVWENSKRATLEAELRKMEKQLEKKKADYTEKVKNQIALIHKAAEEKRAIIEAQRGVELLKVEEVAAKHLATGSAPKKLLGCL